MPLLQAWLSEFGDSKWLLPAVALLIIVAVRSGTLPTRAALRWVTAIAVTAAIVLASKLAFMGWGIGSARLDFTGFSGHAAMSAAIYPPLLVVLGSGRNLSRGGLVVAGLTWAGLIAASRLPLHAHTLSEVVSGFALGCAATTFTMTGWSPTSRSLFILRWLAPAALVIATLQFTAPNVSTHKMVQTTAKTLSGRDKVYTRKWLHTRSANQTQNIAKRLTSVDFRVNLIQLEQVLPPSGFQEFP